MILNTKRIHNSLWRNFPARAKQMPSKVLFVGKKKRRRRPLGHCAPKLWSLATVNELKIIIFVLNFLTALVYTKTIIHLNVSVKFWVFTSPLPGLGKLSTISYLHFGE